MPSHRIDDASQRLTRWLLSAQDLTAISTIDITQEVLSEILGTKRVTIAAAAGDLQRQRLIQYSRGHIRIVNRKGLEKKRLRLLLHDESNLRWTL